MSSSATLMAVERERDVRRRELDVLDARLEDARRARSDVEVRWAATAPPLGLRPLVASMTVFLAANATLFCGYLIILSNCREQMWNAFYVVTAITSLAALPFAFGEGAGGPWRRRLARSGVLLVFGSFLEILYAVWALEGSGFPVTH